MVPRIVAPSRVVKTTSSPTAKRTCARSRSVTIVRSGARSSSRRFSQRIRNRAPSSRSTVAYVLPPSITCPRSPRLRASIHITAVPMRIRPPSSDQSPSPSAETVILHSGPLVPRLALRTGANPLRGLLYAPRQGQRSPRLKVIASKGRMLTGSSSFALPISTHSPARSSNASRVRSVGSTSHR